MSNVSTAHSVRAYDAKKSEALTGQRLAKCRYKSTEKNPAKYGSVCVSVPFVPEDALTDSVMVSRLVPHIRGMIENAQDGILRSLYESSDGTLSTITDSDLSLDACISFMDAESSGGRLTKEFIEAWFVSSVQDYLVALVAEKLGYTPAGTEDGDSVELTEEQMATVGKHIAGYKGLYSSLAGGKTMLQETQVKSLVRVLELVDTDDTSEKLKARLNGMLNKPKVEELLEL